MTIAKMVREMIAKGVDPDVIELAVATAEAAMSGGIPVDAAAEKRRAYDRERKKKLRGIPPESTGIPPDNESGPISIKKESKKKEKKEVERKTALPPDWRPTPEGFAEASMLLGSDARVETEIKKFHNHAAEKGRKSARWNSAWANWVINAVEYGGKREQANRPYRTDQTSGSPQARDDAVITGMARALQRRREARAATDPGRQEFRANGHSDIAGRTDADGGSAAGDAGACRQLTLIPGGNAG